MNQSELTEYIELYKIYKDTEENKKLHETIDKPVSSILADGSYSFEEDKTTFTIKSKNIEVYMNKTDIIWIDGKPDRPEISIEMPKILYDRMKKLEKKQYESNKTSEIMKKLAASYMRDACKDLIGKRFLYNLDKSLHCEFIIEESWIDMLEHYEPIEYNGELWMKVASISWGQGYNSSLYYNGFEDLIAVNDDLCEYSIIQKNYTI